MKSTCKETIVELLLKEKSNEIVANQLLEIARMISITDFPHDWVDMLQIHMDGNEMRVLQIFHVMFKKFRYELATHQLWDEIEKSTAVIDSLTDLLARFMVQPNGISDKNLQSLLLTLKIIRLLSFHDLAEGLWKKLPLIMNMLISILCLPNNVNSALLLISVYMRPSERI